MKKSFLWIFLTLSLFISACGSKDKAKPVIEEDRTAKQTLQGVWVNQDEQYVAFKAKGDTIYYPDSTSMPAYFQIIQDTLVLHGSNVMKYPIKKLTHNLFIFINPNGDEVRLVNSHDADDAALFDHKTVTPLNQNQLIKRDTVVTVGSERYHCYVQVNPTTYKVFKATYNDEGVEVDNIYYDNIVNLNVYHGASKLFSGDFRKKQFAKIVPPDFLEQSVLSDLVFDKANADGISYVAVLVIPDSPSSFQVRITVQPNGKLTMKAK
ncbi:MAG: DUF4738 domain-containing protein [Prevotella sp.]|jgi:hypothetical protein